MHNIITLRGRGANDGVGTTHDAGRRTKDSCQIPLSLASSLPEIISADGAVEKGLGYRYSQPNIGTINSNPCLQFTKQNNLCGGKNYKIQTKFYGASGRLLTRLRGNRAKKGKRA